MSAIPPTILPAGTSAVAGEPDASWLASSWWQQLQPGSWRGVGFVMDTAETRAGRRIAEHEYPYRDTIWAEDLGMLPRRFAFTAFLIGDDCYQQRDAMLAACEQPGEGTLVHPTLGPVQCVLLDFSASDRRQQGRVVEISFSFVVSSTILFPTTAVATGDNTNSQADALDQAATSDFSTGMTSVGTIPRSAFSNLGQFTSQAQIAVDDPARALAAVTGLQGFYGRYSAGNLVTLQPPSATVASALAASIVSREAVLNAIADVQSAADALT
jgi:prophage DNA circulation protein